MVTNQFNLVDKNHVHPVVTGVKGPVGEFAGERVGVNSIATGTGAGWRGQHAADVGVSEVVLVSRIEAFRTEIGSHVDRVGRDSDRDRKIGLLPAAGRFSAEGAGP